MNKSWLPSCCNYHPPQNIFKNKKNNKKNWVIRATLSYIKLILNNLFYIQEFKAKQNLKISLDL
jgi:hypothetical protein